jgi:hypothetical protein
MQKKLRNGHISTKTSVEDEIAHLRGLDLKGLRSRWQSIFRRQAPAHLTRHLLFGVIAYRIQADRFGDLVELWDRDLPQKNYQIEDKQIARIAEQRLVTPNSGGYTRDIKR